MNLSWDQGDMIKAQKQQSLFLLQDMSLLVENSSFSGIWIKLLNLNW